MTKKTLLSVMIAATLSSGMIAAYTAPAFASSSASKAEDLKTKTAEKDLVKVSKDALISMRDLHDARLAIFNGEPEKARTNVDAAVTRISAAVSDADKYAMDIKAPKEKDQYVPFDAYLTVLDTYKVEKGKADQIAKANSHLNKGEQKEALKTLKLGGVNVAVTTQLIPVKFAQEHILKAAELIGKGKYYEANLALKAVDDAALDQTLAFDDTPKAKKDPSPKAKS